MSRYESLLKVEYNSIQQFLEDINKNFAIIQNSPLFRGVPGNPGSPGSTGKPGRRGSNILFLEFPKIIQHFGTAVSSEKSITIDWLNIQIQSEGTRQLLLRALEINEFVANDIIILPDTRIYQFNENLGQWFDTGRALNQQNSVLNDIQTTLNTKITEELKKLVPTLQQLKSGVFKEIRPVGVNVNATGTTMSVLHKNMTALVPFVSSEMRPEQIPLELLEKFRFVGYETADDIKYSQVLGSVKNLNKILDKIIKQPNTTNFSGLINPENMPALVVMQNDDNSGIVLGNPNSSSFREFASIFVEIDKITQMSDFVIQSNRYPISNDFRQMFSLLKMNANRLLFNKNLEIEGNTHLKQDLRVDKNYSGKFIRSGINKFTVQKSFPESSNLVQIGYHTGNPATFNTNITGITEFIDKEIYFSRFSQGIIETSTDGKLVVRKIQNDKPVYTNDHLVWNYFETQEMLNSLVTTDVLLPIYKAFQSLKIDANNFLTAAKLNPSLFSSALSAKLSSLQVGNDTTQVLSILGTDTTVAGNNFNINSNSIIIGNATADRVVTTNSNKKLSFVRQIIPDVSLSSYNQSTTSAHTWYSQNQRNSLVTGQHLGWLLDKIINSTNAGFGNVWTKNELNSGVSMNLKTTETLGGKNLEVRNGTSYLTVLSTGFETNNITRLLNSLFLGSTVFQPNKILSTSVVNGNVVPVVTKYSVDDGDSSISTNYTIANLESKTSPSGNQLQNTLVTLHHLKPLVTEFRTIRNQIANEFYKKHTSSFTELELKGTTLTGVNAINGGTSSSVNRFNYSVTNGTTVVGKLTIPSTTVFSGYSGPKALVMMNTNGTLGFEGALSTDKTSITADNNPANLIPNSGEITGSDTGLNNTDTNVNQVLSKPQWDFGLNMFKQIRNRFKNIFTKTETIDYVYTHLPVGSIIMWSRESAIAAGFVNRTNYTSLQPVHIPFGWAVCDGTFKNGVQTPDMRNQFVAMDMTGIHSNNHIYLQSFVPNQNSNGVYGVGKNYKLDHLKVPSLDVEYKAGQQTIAQNIQVNLPLIFNKANFNNLSTLQLNMSNSFRRYSNIESPNRRWYGRWNDIFNWFPNPEYKISGSSESDNSTWENNQQVSAIHAYLKQLRPKHRIKIGAGESRYENATQASLGVDRGEYYMNKLYVEGAAYASQNIFGTGVMNGNTAFVNAEAYFDWLFNSVLETTKRPFYVSGNITIPFPENMEMVTSNVRSLIGDTTKPEQQVLPLPNYFKVLFIMKVDTRPVVNRKNAVSGKIASPNEAQYDIDERYVLV